MATITAVNTDCFNVRNDRVTLDSGQIGYRYNEQITATSRAFGYQLIEFNLNNYADAQISNISLSYPIDDKGYYLNDDYFFVGVREAEYPSETVNFDQDIDDLSSELIENMTTGTKTKTVAIEDIIKNSTTGYITLGIYTSASRGKNTGYDEGRETSRYMGVGADESDYTLTFNTTPATSIATFTNINKGDNPFSDTYVYWSFSDNSNAFSSNEQTSSQIRYKLSTASNWTTKTVSGTTNSYTIEGSEFAEWADIDIQVRVNGSTIGWSSWTSTTAIFEKIPPDAEINIYSLPDTPFENIRINWGYIANVGNDIQQSSQFRYKLDDNSSWTTATVSGTTNTYTIPAGTFTNYGDITVEARVQSAYTGWGDWASELLEYAVIPPSVTNLAPSKGQPKLDIRLSWAFLSNDERVEDYQIGSQVRYRKTGTSSWTTASTDDNYYLVPANTYELDDVSMEFQARVEANYNSWSDWSSSKTVTFATTPPLAPQLLYPVNAFPSASANIKHEWRYNSEIGDSASKSYFWLEKDGVLEIDGEEINSSNEYYDYLPENTSNDYRWRVQNVNSLDEIGAISEWASYSTLGKPQTPVITNVTNQNKPLFSFAVDTDLSWKLDIYKDNNLIYSSGQQPYDLQYRLTEYIQNGTYTAKMYTYEQRIESDEEIYNFTINTSLEIDDYIAVNINGTNAIELTFNNTIGNALIYRDNNLIAENITGNCYKDYLCANNYRHKYFVRYEQDYITVDTAEKMGVCHSRDTIICDFFDTSSIIIPKSCTTADHSHAVDVTEYVFVGREYPVVSFGENSSANFAYNCTMTAKQVEEFKELVMKRTTIFMKNIRIGRVKGTIKEFTSTVANGDNYTVSFTIVGGGEIDK